MNQYLIELTQLSALDRQLADYTPKIAQINAVLDASKNQIAAHEAQKAAILTEISEIHAQIRHTNTTIAELSAKLDGIGKKSSASKNEKEVRAVLLEEDLAQDQLNAANEEIARLDRLAQTKNDNIAQIDETIEGLNEQSRNADKEAKAQLDAIEKERAAIFEQKTALTAKMNSKILSFYEKIRKWAKNSAVVPVRKQACYGCYMKINDKTMSAVIKGEDITTCPHCGRILYHEENLA